jgi:outer membrane protein assembly factor BamE (lipoprotein component of BamABCDE complex)
MKKNILLKTALTLTLAAATTSCVTQGHNFESKVSWIKPGETRKQDVQLVLKKPYSVGSSSGMQTWTYGYYRYRLFGKSNTKELRFYWNSDQTVNRFSFNTSFPKDIRRAESGN